MARTTSELVQGIIQVQEGVDLAPFIDTANQLTTDICGEYDYTAVKLELIERWLAAHFYAIFDSQLSAAKAGSVSVRFQNKIDYGLKLTHWGQTAMRLDTEGGLAAWDNAANTTKRIKVSIGWLGTEIESIPVEG